MEESARVEKLREEFTASMDPLYDGNLSAFPNDVQELVNLGRVSKYEAVIWVLFPPK